MGGGNSRSIVARCSALNVMSSAAALASTCSSRAGLWDRQHAGLRQHPGQRHLEGACSHVRGRSARSTPAASAADPARSGCRPSPGCRVLAAPGQQVPFDAAPRRGCRAPGCWRRRAARDGRQLRHLVGVEVADAPVADLAVAAQPLERRHGLRQRVRAAPVQQVEVEPVGAEPPQAALAGGDRALGRRVVRVDLADQEDLVAPAPRSPRPPPPRRRPRRTSRRCRSGVRPRSSPRRSAATSAARRPGCSPMRQVPWPSTGTASPPGSGSVRRRFPSLTRSDRAWCAGRA